MGSVLPAAGAAASWGVSDFLGGATTRSLPVARVLAVSQATGLALVTATVLVRGTPLPHGAAAWEAAGAGVAAIAALALLYVALARGNAIVVAPLAATGSAIPMIVGLVQGDPVRPADAVGIALAFAGVLAASWEPGDRTETADRGGGLVVALLALGAAAATGLYLTLIDLASRQGAVGAIEGVRIAATGTMAVVLAGQLSVGVARRVHGARGAGAGAGAETGEADRASGAVELGGVTRSGFGNPLLWIWVAVVCVGITDALAELGFASASVGGHLDVVSVVAGSYPAVTVLLAVAVLRQRAHPVQAVGAVATLIGVLLLGSTGG